MPFIDWGTPETPITVQTAILGLNHSGLYYHPVAPSEKEVRLKHRIDELYTQDPFLGSRRITVLLRREGWDINRKAVQRHMREMGIAGICPRPDGSQRAPGHRVFPYLLRGLPIERADPVWGIDITYVRMRHGWMYLVAILDWYSRYVVAWELDQTLHLDFVLTAMKRALNGRRPAIVNSDQGSHFTSPQFRQLLLGQGVKISMDGRGRALDNVFTERSWRSVKYEEVYLHDYETPRQARQGIDRYLERYNNCRTHQSLVYQTPAHVYEST